jgi:hypothetical protein
MRVNEILVMWYLALMKRVVKEWSFIECCKSWVFMNGKYDSLIAIW